MDRWGNLNLQQKNQLLGIYASKGYTDLASIISHYNSFAEGGSVDNEEGNPPNKHWYDSYRSWRRKMSKHKGIDIKNDDTYDYKTFYDENQDEAWRMLDEDAETHFTDLYKYPNHPTFSSQSMYSQQWQRDHNVKNWAKAPRGGDWGTDENGNDVFYHSYFTAATPEKIRQTAEYLRQNDPGVKAVFRPKSTGITLPTVTVTSHPELTEQQRALINAGMYMPKTLQKKIDEVNAYYADLAKLNNEEFPDLESKTYEVFNGQIWDLENQRRVGYNPKTRRWVQHGSPEGGEPTIGGGIKLNSGNKKWVNLYEEQGYLTDSQVREAMQENADKAYRAAESAYIRAYGRKDWETLSPTLRALLMDISYNTGNVSGFKTLMKAIHERDFEAIKKQHHRSYKDRRGVVHPVKNRNNYFDSVLANTENLYNE